MAQALKADPITGRHRLEYACVRAVAGLIALLPYRGALAVGWLTAALIWLVSPGRVREAGRRIRSVFPDSLSEAEVSRIAWMSVRNFIFNGVEMVLNIRVTPSRVDGFYDDRSYLDDLLEQTKSGVGGLIAVAHMGSWELGAILCHHHGIPIFTLAAAQKNALTNDFINYLRRRPGIDTLARGGGSVRQILARLKAGQFLAILPDLRSPTPGVAVPFLGGMANIAVGMASLARHANVPIFPVLLTRTGWTRHRGRRGCPPIRPDPDLSKEEDIARMTREVMAVLDAAIRQDPGQWFWFNKRWILDPLPNLKAGT